MPTYITSTGKFLPGDPIPMDRVDEYIGPVGSSEVRDLVLKNSGIATRHYAIDRQQRTTLSNGDLAAAAIRDAIDGSSIELADVDLLAVATSAGDYHSPALANMVHGDLFDHPCEVVAANGLCACGMMALKAAHLSVSAGLHANAVSCGSELVSRQFKASRYTNGQGLDENGDLPFDVAFLRYMLSDGAGAVVLQDLPAADRHSYRIEWITLTSYAHITEPCMYLGNNGVNGHSYQDYPTVQEAALDGAMSLRQNMRLLPRLIGTCAKETRRLLDKGMFDPDRISRVLFHYSSETLRERFQRALVREGVDPMEDRWFSNLTRVGNIGCAAIYVMLAELDRSGELEPDDQLLCFVPESGRFSAAHMLLTVVGPKG
jgi:3-oxoacyl-[acyl-carrier-protein] synthase-3